MPIELHPNQLKPLKEEKEKLPEKNTEGPIQHRVKRLKTIIQIE